METVSEIRLQNLNFLIEQYKTIANLNKALGRSRTDSTLSQIKNKVKINNRKGNRSMGYTLARTIEDKLNLPHGWMDEFHESIQPETLAEPIPLSDIKELTTIPVYIQPEKEISGNCNPKLKGEIQLPNIMLDQFSQNGKLDLRGYIPTEAAMFNTLPAGSIVLVNTSVKSYVGDGLYFLRINNFLKFRKISQLINGNFEVESDVKKETVHDLESIEILGKVTNVWVNIKA